MTDTQRLGRHRRAAPDRVRLPARRRKRLIATITVACTLAAIGVTLVTLSGWRFGLGTPAKPHNDDALPTTPSSYIGLYVHSAPSSYSAVRGFAAATGVKPGVVVYYSGWAEAFEAGFAATVARNGAVPLVQMDPSNISLAAIAAGQYDGYLETYAKAVRAYRRPVILSFGHEMNGYWYTWGNTHTSPADFVNAWRHIVTLFRTEGAKNVTWLWTINTVHTRTGVPAPSPWWPGSNFVTWVGIDGYYVDPSSEFASVFGPTIADVRTLTKKPIFIAETSAAPNTDQPAKINDLFAGVHLYGVLGFVWFDSVDVVDWRLTSSDAIAAFRHGAETYHLPSS